MANLYDAIAACRAWIPAWFTLSNALSLATLVVLVYTWRAAKRQAEAAEKLTEATQKQIEASHVQAEAAREQQRLTRRQLEEALRPVLLLVSGGSGGPIRDTVLKNQGAGPALDVVWFYGTLQAKEPREFDHTILGAKQEVTIQYEWGKAAKQGMGFVYKSLTGSANATLIDWKNGSMHTIYLPNID